MTPAAHKTQLNRYLIEGERYYQEVVGNLTNIKPYDKIREDDKRIIKQVGKSLRGESHDT